MGTPTPGWYDDPAGGPVRKYWDGADWNDAIPAKRSTSNGPRTGGNRVNDLLAKYGLPLFIGAVSFIVLGIALDVAALGAIGAITVIATVVMLVATRGSRRLPAAQFSTTPVSDQVRRDRLQQRLSQELMLKRGRIESAT